MRTIGTRRNRSPITASLLLGFLAFVLAACGGSGTSASGSGGSTGGFTGGSGGTSGGGGGGGLGSFVVEGRLLRADGQGAGLAGARVVLAPALGRGVEPLQDETKTDSQGRYSFRVLDQGEYTLRVEGGPNGYQDAEIPITVVEEQTAVPSLGILPTGIDIERIDVVVPQPDGPGGTYVAGRQYSFRADVYDRNRGQLQGWNPNWAISGGVGSIDESGGFLAASVGTGEVEAFFLAGSRRVSFKKPISVSDGIGPAPSLFALRWTSGSNAALWQLNARSGQLVDEIPQFIPGTRGLFTRDAQGRLFAVTDRSIRRYDPDTKQFVAGVMPRTTWHVTVAPNGNILAFFDGGTTTMLATIDSNTLVLQPEIPALTNISRVYDTAVGADGKLYMTCMYQITRSIFYSAIVRWDMTPEGRLSNPQRILTIDQDLASETSNPNLWGLAFAQNGDMIVASPLRKKLLRYTSSGTELGNGWETTPASQLYSVKRATSLFEAGDEVLFVNTGRNVFRLRYRGGAFEPLDQGRPWNTQSLREILIGQ